MMYQDHLLDTLDRRHELVELSDGSMFFLECRRFLDWLATDMVFSAYLTDIVGEQGELSRTLAAQLAPLVARADALRRTALAAIPAFGPHDDPPISPAASDDASYFSDWNLSGHIARLGAQLGKGDAPRRSGEIDTLFTVFKQRLERDPHPQCPATPRAMAELAKLRAQYETTSAVMRAERESCAGFSLLELRDVLEAAVQPFAPPGLRSNAQDQVLRVMMDRVGKRPSLTTTDLKAHLRRLYVEVRARVGSSLSRRRLVDRFSARCTWYDRDRLRGLVSRGRRVIAQREAALATELARFLFDNGVWAMVRPRFGHHELDILGAYGRPILVEAKAHVDRCVPAIIRGIAQLHAYMCSLEGTPFHAHEGHYVVFRLAGPIHDMPPTIRTNRYAIHTHTVDLGLSSDSGSRQPKPVSIRLETILDTIAGQPDAAPKTRSRRRERA